MFNPGIEPGTVCVLGRRDSHYTNWTIYHPTTLKQKYYQSLSTQKYQFQFVINKNIIIKEIYVIKDFSLRSSSIKIVLAENCLHCLA